MPASWANTIKPLRSQLEDAVCGSIIRTESILEYDFPGGLEGVLIDPPLCCCSGRCASLWHVTVEDLVRSIIGSHVVLGVYYFSDFINFEVDNKESICFALRLGYISIHRAAIGGSTCDRFVRPYSDR